MLRTTVSQRAAVEFVRNQGRVPPHGRFLGVVPVKVSKNDNDVELFETIGTPKDRTSFEPFAEFRSIIGDDEETEYDPLRDGPLRYLGYSNEVGEAFAAWLFNGGVPLSYAVAIGYVLFDTFDKYQKTLQEAKDNIGYAPDVDRDRLIATIGLERGLDTITWQLLASVAIPGYTIHTIVGLSSKVIHHNLDTHSPLIQGLASTLSISQSVALQLAEKSLPTFVGLAAIPFIVHPIDSGVHAILNYTLRPLLRSYICTIGGREAGLCVCDDCHESLDQN